MAWKNVNVDSDWTDEEKQLREKLQKEYRAFLQWIMSIHDLKEDQQPEERISYKFEPNKQHTAISITRGEDGKERRYKHTGDGSISYDATNETEFDKLAAKEMIAAAISKNDYDGKLYISGITQEQRRFFDEALDEMRTEAANNTYLNFPEKVDLEFPELDTADPNNSPDANDDVDNDIELIDGRFRTLNHDGEEVTLTQTEVSQEDTDIPLNPKVDDLSYMDKNFNEIGPRYYEIFDSDDYTEEEKDAAEFLFKNGLDEARFTHDGNTHIVRMPNDYYSKNGEVHNEHLEKAFKEIGLDREQSKNFDQLREDLNNLFSVAQETRNEIGVHSNAGKKVKNRQWLKYLGLGAALLGAGGTTAGAVWADVDHDGEFDALDHLDGPEGEYSEIDDLQALNPDKMTELADELQNLEEDLTSFPGDNNAEINDRTVELEKVEALSNTIENWTQAVNDYSDAKANFLSEVDEIAGKYELEIDKTKLSQILVMENEKTPDNEQNGKAYEEIFKAYDKFEEKAGQTLFNTTTPTINGLLEHMDIVSDQPGAEAKEGTCIGAVDWLIEQVDKDDGQPGVAPALSDNLQQVLDQTADLKQQMQEIGFQQVVIEDLQSEGVELTAMPEAGEEKTDNEKQPGPDKEEEPKSENDKSGPDDKEQPKTESQPEPEPEYRSEGLSTSGVENLISGAEYNRDVMGPVDTYNLSKAIPDDFNGITSTFDGNVDPHADTGGYAEILPTGVNGHSDYLDYALEEEVTKLTDLDVDVIVDQSLVHDQTFSTEDSNGNNQNIELNIAIADVDMGMDHDRVTMVVGEDVTADQIANYLHAVAEGELEARNLYEIQKGHPQDEFPQNKESVLPRGAGQGLSAKQVSNGLLETLTDRYGHLEVPQFNAGPSEGP
jgi:hypothetical protein